MKKTLLGLLATAMLITACQKEAAAPTNEATLVPKCLEGEFIGLDESQYYMVIKITNAKVGTTWTPTSGKWQNPDGKFFNDTGVTFENIVGISIISLPTTQSYYLNRGTKVYISVDSLADKNSIGCSLGSPLAGFNYSPVPMTKLCVNYFSTTKCK